MIFLDQLSFQLGLEPHVNKFCCFLTQDHLGYGYVGSIEWYGSNGPESATLSSLVSLFVF